MHIDELMKDVLENSSHRAFRLLFETYYPALCIFGKRYIESEEQVEDIIQDIFVALWENRGKIRVDISTKNYLMTMTRNSCLNYLQHERVMREYVAETEKRDDDIGSESDELLLLSELNRLLADTLKSLPVEYQKVFIMSRLHNKNYLEIAKELGISVKSVGRYKQKVEKVLGENLKDYITVFILSYLLTHTG